MGRARVEVVVMVMVMLAGWSGASEYRLCATMEQEAPCKWIEASRDEVRCVRVSDSVDCLLKMQKKEADLGSFYPEEAFMAAKFLGNEAVVLAEVRHPDRQDKKFSFETVAVGRKTLLGGLSALKGTSYCHPGFSKAQYWSDRVLKAFEKKVLEHFKDEVPCQAAARSAFEDDLYRLSRVFAKACRPGTWAVRPWWDKKMKRDYHTLCDQCERPSTCSYDVRNTGTHSDALRCLTHRGGNVTYTALEFVQEYFQDDLDQPFSTNSGKESSFRFGFLCPDGTIESLTTSEPCSWIKQPWTSVVGFNSANPEMSRRLREWLDSGNDVPWINHLRTILTKGKGVLKFRDHPLSVAEYIKEGRAIPSESDDSCRPPIRWCVIDPTEKKKCEFISTAAFTHGLPILIRCVPAESKIDCLRKIAAREADVVYVDTDLGYISRRVYNLTASAYLETQRTSNYYGVVVVKGKTVPSINRLRGKKACFPRYNGLGWLTYIEALRHRSLIPATSCSTSKKAVSFLSSACAPGAKDSALNEHPERADDKLCKGCFNPDEGSSCEASEENPYYGEVGALRCLRNGDGDVAFLDFHAVKKYLASGQEDMTGEDFRILCRDGNIGSFNMSSPERCAFVEVNGGEMVARNDLDVVQKNNLHLTLMELDDLFGTTSRSYNPALRMFEPFDGVPNVLFKESAVSLVSAHETQNSFLNNYIRLLASFENCLDDNGASVSAPALFPIVLFSFFFLLRHF